MTELASIVGVVVAAALVVMYLRLRRQDQIGEYMKKRQGARLVSRADYVEGMEMIPVALSLTTDTLVYENPDLDASFELSRIDEVEYSDELATGKNLPGHCRVMRLRCHGAAFEFVMDVNEAKKWEAVLPSRMADQPSTARAV